MNRGIVSVVALLVVFAMASGTAAQSGNETPSKQPSSASGGNETADPQPTSSTSGRQNGTDSKEDPDDGRDDGTDDSDTTDEKSAERTPRDDGKTCEGAECKEYCKEQYDTSDAQECRERHCDAYPEAEACRKGKQTRQPAPTATRKPEPRPDERQPSQDAPCTHCDALQIAPKSMRYVSFGTEGGDTLTNYAVRGNVLLESASIDFDETPQLKRSGNVLMAKSDDVRLRIHDNPTGLLHYKGDEEFRLTFPADASIVTVAQGDDGSGYKITYASGAVAILRLRDAQWDGQSVSTEKFAALHFPDKEVKQASESEHKKRVNEATEKGRVGANVRIAKTTTAPSAVAGIESVVEPAEITSYDDVDVTVDPIPDVATNQTPLRVVVSAELDEGRTITLDLDPALFPGLEEVGVEDALELRYYDLHDDGTETEVVFRQAASLSDVLDATDDGGQPEYWIVEDADGLQVLVSVPHWSAHAITLASVAEILTEPSVLMGIVAGIGGAAAASLVMLRPRREEPL